MQKYGYKAVRQNRPFWLPASNYYVLTTAVTAAVFFLLWAVLNDEGDEMPWVGAGIGASVILGGAVFLREFVLRNARERYVTAQRRLDHNIAVLPALNPGIQNPNKLTLEKNAAIIKQIKQKSEAARILNKFANGHLEVFEVCNEYLLLSRNELKTVAVGSPRLAALRRGREVVKELHRFHLLEWAEIESRAHSRDAKNNVTINERLEASQKALDVIHTALQFYPNESNLKHSETALTEFIGTIKISHWIEQAERSVFKGHYKRAVEHYQDALFYLGRENAESAEHQMIKEKITAEIEKIRGLEGIKKGKREVSTGNSRSEGQYD